LYKSNLIKIISTFSPKELKDFGEFVLSPFFNKNESTVRLYEYIRKEYPDFAEEKMEKEYVHSRLFPGSEYNDGFMRTIIFNLNSLAEEFLAYTNFRNDNARHGIMLVEELNRRKLDKILLKHYKEVDSNVNKLEDKNRDFLYYKYLLERVYYNYQNWSRFRQKNLKDYESERIRNETDYLSSYFLGRALGNYRFLITKAETENIEIHIELFDKLIEFLTSSDNKYLKSPSVKLHLYEILLIREKEDKYYYILKDILLDPDFKITKDERFSLLNVLQTFCSWKIYNGDVSFLQQRFRLYKEAVKGEFCKGSDDIYFDDLLFANIVLVGINVGETEWVHRFVNKFKEAISPDNREIIVNYCLGRIFFTRNEFEKALEVLSKIKSVKHVQFKLVVRNLTLMIYYELGLYDLAYSNCDSYRHFLKSIAGSFAKARFERQSNFLKFYSRLIKLKEKPGRKETDELNYDIGKTSNVVEKNWLIEKAAKLKK
jgi:hypothetical protein